MSKTTAVNTGVDVLVTDTAVLTADLGRHELTIVNVGPNAVDLTLGSSAAVAANGIRLAAGASYTTNGWQGAVRAIAQTGTQRITVCWF